MSKPLALIVLVCLASSCSLRGPRFATANYALPPSPVSSWDRVLDLSADSQLIVELDAGEQIRGRLTHADADSLTVDDGRSSQRQLARSSIERVKLRNGARDSGANGALIGAALGAGAGSAVAVGVSETADIATRITVPVLGAVGAGVGGLVGYLVDRGDRTVVVYRR